MLTIKIASHFIHIISYPGLNVRMTNLLMPLKAASDMACNLWVMKLINNKEVLPSYFPGFQLVLYIAKLSRVHGNSGVITFQFSC
jgi:hypothetical protein